jgi:hypothetical protein
MQKSLAITLSAVILVVVVALATLAVLVSLAGQRAGLDHAAVPSGAAGAQASIIETWPRTATGS